MGAALQLHAKHYSMTAILHHTEGGGNRLFTCPAIPSRYPPMAALEQAAFESVVGVADSELQSADRRIVERRPAVEDVASQN